jgi:hypothetical protein
LRVGAASVAFVEGLLRVRPSSVDPRQAAANNRMPSRLGYFVPALFCAAPMPNQKRSLSIDRSASSQEAGGNNSLLTGDVSV